MRDIVISMQNTLLSEAVARALSEAGEFRVEQVLPGMRRAGLSLRQVRLAALRPGASAEVLSRMRRPVR